MAEPKRTPVVAVIGPGDCDEALKRQAFEVGALLARRGAIVVTGGRAGVMEGASCGAAGAGGIVVGILPGTDRSQANPCVGIPIITGLGEARNAVIARTADALIAIGGGYGTLTEIAFALKFGKRVVSLNSTWVHIAPAILPAATAEEAVDLALPR